MSGINAGRLMPTNLRTSCPPADSFGFREGRTFLERVILGSPMRTWRRRDMGRCGNRLPGGEVCRPRGDPVLHVSRYPFIF